MIPSMKKRFWTDVSVTPESTGFIVQLDGHEIRTPSKARLILPTKPLAEEVADEWRAVKTEVLPQKMPMTRRANAAIDKVAPQRTAVETMLAEYGETDLLCYRAGHPQELAERQARAWDPLLDWAARDLGARLIVTSGVVPVAQDRDALRRLGDALGAFSTFQLTAVHDLITLSGSLVIGLAACAGAAEIETLWDASQVDEMWQVQLWGEDDEARDATGRKRQDFLDAFRFFFSSR